jgi:hypothetical protein
VGHYRGTRGKSAGEDKEKRPTGRIKVGRRKKEEKTPADLHFYLPSSTQHFCAEKEAVSIVVCLG